MRNTATFIAAAVSGAIIDIVTKWVVFSRLEEFGKITLIHNILNILRSENEGVVFGLFPGKTNAFIILSVIAIIAILCVYIWSDKKHIMPNLALGLVLAGAIGNLWDRVWYGHVRDFIDLHAGNKYHWPAFNIADSLICIGISIMVVTSFLKSQHKDTA